MLRDWRSVDSARLLRLRDTAVVTQDTDLLHNLPGPTGADVSTWIDEVMTAQHKGTARAWAIVDQTVAAAQPAESLPVIGNVMVSRIDRANSLGWVSYWLVPEARGRGLASAALRQAVRLAHDDLGIYRLELGYRINNPASARVAAAAGFIVEGRQREKLYYDGTRYDTEECSHLAGDPIPTPIPSTLDHLVYAVPDLEAGVRDFASLTGLTPVYGGAHVGLGTANYLVPLVPQGRPDDSPTYLEIVGPDPNQDVQLAPGQLGNSDSPALQRWAIHPDDYDATLAAAQRAGVPVGAAHEMSRKTPEGTLLQWRLTTPEADATGAQQIPYGGAVPFLIDWQDSQHPSERLRGGDSATLATLEFFAPEPDKLEAKLAPIGVAARVAQASQPGFAATLETLRGTVTLSSR